MARWQVLPAMIVRPAGFAFARLAPLRFVRSVAAAEAFAAASRERAAAGNEFNHALSQERYEGQPAFDDPAIRKQISRHVKRARAFARQETADVPSESITEVVRVIPRVAALADSLREHHARREAAARELDTTFAAELDQQRATLRGIFEHDDRLREAVFLESSEAFERVEQLVGNPGPRDARARQRERLAVMYLQRFCAKNDTNSICGPHAIARIAEQPTTPRIEIADGGELRRTYFSHWAAERLLEAASARAGDVVPIRVNPTARLAGKTVSWCVIEHDATVALRRRYGRVTLPLPALYVLRVLMQRPRTLAELVQLAVPALDLGGEDVTALVDVGLREAVWRDAESIGPDDIASLVDEMCAAGLLMRRPTLPAGLFYPLDTLLVTLDRWPDDAGKADTRALQDLLAGFAAARMPERAVIYRDMVTRFREATGDAGQRGQGRHYADRSIVHEDCHATIRADLGPETTAPLLASLAPLLDAASLPLELRRETVREWFRNRFGEGTRIAALDAHRAFDDERAIDYAAQTATTDALRAAIERVRGCFTAAVEAAGSGPVHVSAAALAEAVPPNKRPTYASLDLMLCGRAPALVIGEVHGFMWLPTCLLDIVPQPMREEVIAHMRRTVHELAGGKPTAEALFAHTQATDRRFPMTDMDLWLIDRGDRPGVELGHLEVELEGDRFRFFDGDREIVPVTTYTTYPFILYASQLAPCIDDFADRFFPDALLPEAMRTGDAPRMLVDGLAFRRQTWRRSAAELQAMLAGSKDATLLYRAQELRAHLGCPGVVFASFANEPKPVLVDFDNFFLVEAFAHLVERQAADTMVRVTEMLPGPDELFAVGPDGARTSELRMGLYRRGAT